MIGQLLLGADLKDYAPVPFWSWNNELERDRLILQIREMKSAGCGGFIIHARTGLKTEYLGEKWFEMVEACLAEARASGMNVWIYDENGWPSGFVGGKLLKDESNLACYLVREERPSFDPSAFAVFERTGGGMKRLFGPKEGVSVYHTVYVRRSPANTDILDPKVVSRFLAETHEKYYARFKESFGRELTGFFTDEPQYFRWGTPFTPVLRSLWREEYGEDIADGIIALFFDGEDSYPFRVRYYRAMNRLYTQNYYRRLYEWCEAHNCKLTGHSVEETFLFTQMWGCAGCTSSYEFEHIPAIDNLSRGGSAKLSARQVGSAAGQLGKKQILTETFGCCGYDVTPKELKAIAEKQCVHGVNLLCHHLVPYSLAGQGKTDHPPCFGRHMTWWKEFGEFNRYFTRLGWLLANSETCVNCTVLNPMSSVYLTYDRFHEEPSLKTDKAFSKLQEELNRWGILYDITDESILEGHGCVSEGKLRVGKRTYDFVILPECETLSASTERFLTQFVASGGKLLVCGGPTHIDGVRAPAAFRSNVSFSEIAAAGKVRLKTDGKAEYTYRKGERFEFLYLVNVEKEPAHLTVPEGFSRFDLLSLETFAFPREFTLKGGESVLLVPCRGEEPVSFGEAEEISSLFRFVSATENNLTLDKVCIGFDGEHYGQEEPLAAAFDRLLRARYCGRLFLKFAFTVTSPVGTIRLRREKGNYLSSSLNGQKIAFRESGFDFGFEEADISQAICKGRNEYVCELNFYERPEVFWTLYSPEATESVKNCLWYDTELENISVVGDFCVDEKRQIVPPAAPRAMSRLHEAGFPYFAGRVNFSANVFGKSRRALLTVRGDVSLAEISVNGNLAGSSLFCDSVMIELEEGKENRLEISAVSSLRNLFGPFHFKGDDDCVDPFRFTMRGSWENGSSPYYDPEYRISPFGVNSVTIAFERPQK